MKTILKGINTITTMLCIAWVMWRPLGIAWLICDAHKVNHVELIFDGIAIWSNSTMSVTYISYMTLLAVFGFALLKIVGICILHKLIAKGLN